MAEARQSLVWHGEAITEKMRAAQIAGVNATMGACAVEAKSSHAWQNRTGTLEGGIGIAEYAREDESGVVGQWGVQDVRYALIHELGGVITAKTAKALAIPQPDGSVRFVKSVTIPARPYLRPAADKVYPSLAGRIRVAYDRQEGASV
jgi:phage gpG-like protein